MPASEPAKPKPSLADSSTAGPSETYQVKQRISFHNKANQASKATQANQASKASKQSTAKQTKAKQASKPRKSTSLASSRQIRTSKLNTRNSTKRRRKASFGWVSGVQPREPRKSTKQANQNKQAKLTKKASKWASERASKQPTKQATNQLTNQPTNQASKQASKQLTNHSTKQASKQDSKLRLHSRLRPPSHTGQGGWWGWGHKKFLLNRSKSDMYKFRVQIYINKVQICVCQKSYGFYILVKLEGWQTFFKIPICRTVFKNSCSTSNFAGVGALFDKFHWFFCSKSRACQLASLPGQTKPSGHKPSGAKWNLSSGAWHIVT